MITCERTTATETQTGNVSNMVRMAYTYETMNMGPAMMQAMKNMGRSAKAALSNMFIKQIYTDTLSHVKGAAT